MSAAQWWLDGLEIEKVALVDDPANPHAEIALYKARVRKATCPACKAMVADDAATCPECGASMSEITQKALTAEDVQKRIDAAVEKATADAAASAKAEIEKARAEADALKATVAKLADERALEDAMRFVKTVSVLGVTADDFAATVRTLRTKTPAEAKIVEDVLAKAAAALSQSKLFEEVGSGQPGGGPSADDKLQAMAKARRAQHPEETAAVAYAKVLQTPEGMALLAEDRRHYEARVRAQGA